MQRTVAVIASILLAMTVYVANFGYWVSDAAIDTDNFVESAMTAFDADGSHEAIATIVAEQAVEQYPVLLLFEAGLVNLFTSLLATGTFDVALELAAVDIHTRILAGDQSAIVVDLEQYRDTILGTIEGLSPELAARIPAGLFFTFELLEAGVLPDVSDEADRIVSVARLALVAALALALLLALYLRKPSRILTAIGAALLMASVATAILVPGARRLMQIAIDDAAYKTLATNLYDELLVSLALRSWILGTIGIVLLGAGLVIRLMNREATPEP
ncbi:MAG: hypothetical protein ACR2N7_10075 [Acidimicrobiia bacterium]